MATCGTGAGAYTQQVTWRAGAQPVPTSREISATFTKVCTLCVPMPPTPRGFQLESATRGSAINVLQVGIRIC